MTDTSSGQYKRECEARHVLTFPKEERTAFYLAVQAIRGQKATDELIAEVKRQHQLRESKTAEISL